MKKEFFPAFIVYIFSWLLSLVLVLIGAMSQGLSFSESLSFFGKALTSTNFAVAIHIFFVLLYLIFLVVRYFLRTYRKRGFKIMSKQLSLRFLMPVLLIFGIYKLLVFKNSFEHFEYNWIQTVENRTGISNDLYQIDGKHRGMSVFGWFNRDFSAIDDLIKTNTEWVAVIPFLDQENEESLEMRTPREFGKWSRRDSLHIKTISALREKKIHVMLKPHLWLGSGWRSNVKHTNHENWDIWFESYRKNMLHYARMAAETDVELFCIGTELRSSLEKQPKKWLLLVQEIKTLYHGKLTYAANWDGEYDFVEFWNEMDYIGIQAYFPLTNKPNPDLQQIKQGWKKHTTMLSNLSKKHGKPILFTEIGYKSESSGTIKPWEWGSSLSILSKQKSDKTQQLAYQALYEEFWDKNWFAGTYIWQWNTQTKKENAPTNLDFSPRFKPAENTIAKWYNQVADE
ncbi:glycoside hydrolase family 113 [Aquimarina litoralis]|uniref:glycoside hydrolase family 113 n=1 Tax=Aquimarina litoralis TaxID=584605 RepID=UPI001C58AAB0|nr:hypothetical protein [Aquimarina litoralis]MBW1296502.1 hypothetical protein [Aquimarina litoralis]